MATKRRAAIELKVPIRGENLQASHPVWSIANLIKGKGVKACHPSLPL